MLDSKGFEKWIGKLMKPNLSKKNRPPYLAIFLLSLLAYPWSPVHGLGLKLDINIDCDSHKNEVRDATAWAALGIDFIKPDAWKDPASNTAFWTNMRDAFLAMERLG